jgi:glycosyltransferase involved in cell wall biosynthesis
VNLLLWHVHGSWTTAFVQGPHRYIVPVLPDRGADGRGRARTYTWPDSVVERTPRQLREEHVDVVVLQRPHEEDLAAQWLGRAPGRDLPAVYLEHNAPQGRINEMRHPVADRDDLLLVHVTHFNALFWDCGGTRTRVVEHGVCDPGHLYTGELPRALAALNEPVRRARVTGTDLLPRFAAAVPLDLYGIGAGELGGVEDPTQAELHREVARHRVYLHPVRWTSLGLTLIEAMQVGMPVVALGTTEVAEAVPSDAGVVSNRLEVLCDALRQLVRDPERARAMGDNARRAALRRHGLGRFLADWDAVLQEAVSGAARVVA